MTQFHCECIPGSGLTVFQGLDQCSASLTLGGHPPAAYHAVCVEQLLVSGARCLGITRADEFTYRLDGESYFYGTPVNSRHRVKLLQLRIK
jgi:Asp-tRNA(Asn)/Glu-tRNA(Gln) amidotransferase A subunit family amidase